MCHQFCKGFWLWKNAQSAQNISVSGDMNSDVSKNPEPTGKNVLQSLKMDLRLSHPRVESDCQGYASLCAKLG